MGKYKVVVYAIAKNEEKYADAWAKNMSEADAVYVLLDPTTSDRTKEILESNGVIVKEKLISPWKFDKARNESLKLVPKDTDICVCTDLDELFDPGWRQILEDNWKEDTNQAIYKHYYNANRPNELPNIFDDTKIHDRNSFKWKWSIHEHLVTKKPQYVNYVHMDIMLRHYPDDTKVRGYRNLLEQAVKTSKKDARYVALLAEEYYIAKMYDDVEKTCRYLLKLKNLSAWHICMAYKYLIVSKNEQLMYADVKKLSYEALSNCDYCRFFYGELGRVCILNYDEHEIGISMLKKCMEIKEDIIIGRECEWKDIAYIKNLISMGYYYLRDYDNAIKYVEMAINENPNDQIYKNNLELYKKAKENN